MNKTYQEILDYDFNLSIQKNGSVILLFMHGTPQQIQDRHWSLLNWSAISMNKNRFGDTIEGENEPEMISDNCAEAWTNPAKLKQYFENIALTLLIDNGFAGAFKNVDGGLINKAREVSAYWLENLPTESDKKFGGGCGEYSMGKISAEKPDQNFFEMALTKAFASA